ncbi:aldolase [Hoyosella sp. G463]|uniref:Aldolase n=1 Tax=Lolliginicoccus lacisalsi TaxID=2742202 RepID=A0A927JF27_9ACTN|nr:aldolase/citrate lyase family protein [Lolliginicoccus lacisalsi]MBD8507885.1 aldolase [Lolliginicoccus lacisalsi]
MTSLAARLATLLDPVDECLAAAYPSVLRPGQPPHTVYVAASDAGPGTVTTWGGQACELLEQHRVRLAWLVGDDVLDAVADRLRLEPIADIRYDFEDGYGWRPDATEDAHARAVGQLLASAPARPPSAGIRTKGLAAHERRRMLRTLELVLDAAGGVPGGFVLTVPKLRHPEQVPAILAICEHFERAHGLEEGTLRFELQIESPQAIIAADGTVPVARAIHAAGARLSGLHYGTFDYSAACGIAPQHQTLEHPVADHAKAVMLAAAAQTGVWVCDGSTNIVPSGGASQRDSALELHFRLVSRALAHGYYQGWDMHPGHLVTRWAATYQFYRESLRIAAPRLDSYLQQRSSDVIDEPASAQALATIVLRGLEAGAFAETDVVALSPLCTRATLTGLAARVMPSKR